jgi:signal transduction histidine kinase
MLANRQSFRDFEVPTIFPNGDIHYLVSSGVPVYDGVGRFKGYRGIGRDVTEERRHERELMTAMEEAEAASRSKSAFLAHMSHELRTPLNAILGYSEAMSLGIAGGITPRGREYLGHVQSAGKQLLALVTDILDLSRLEAGKAELNEEKFPLRLLAEQAVDMCRPSADKKRLAIAVDADAIDIRLLADRRAMLQMLLNLLANAVKFTEAGSVTVGWELDGQWFVLTVRDTGGGIAEADINRVTVAFERAGNAISGKHEGVGLGLAIVSNLAKLHGGELKLRSVTGQGTSAQLRLPASRVSRPPSDQAAAA